MKRIAFLACAETLPAGREGLGERRGKRRGDAFEHDLFVAALRPAFEAAGLELIERDWRAPLATLGECDAALLGTAWDYQDDFPAFLERLETLEARGVRVWNPSPVVRWNGDKRYLRELADKGVPSIPALWFASAGAGEVAIALDAFGARRVVVKRQVGAGGLDQHMFGADDLPPPGWRTDRPCLIQPFLPSIRDEGELTFVYIGGQFCHSLRKRPAAGEYRVQSLYGGTEEAHPATPTEQAAADTVMAALPFGDLLYARIDMVRLDDGSLALMEAELIEPYLYPEQGPELGERLARTVKERLR